MKPIQIGLLVVVGAIGGALVMKMTQPRPKAAPEVAQSQPAAPVAAPVQPVQPPPAPLAEAAPPVATPQKPSPATAPVARKASKPVRVANVRVPAEPAKNDPA